MASGDVTLSANSVSLLVIANVLPLFGAFGQDYTNYFLSRSIDWPDWIVFAIGPLGVVWILSATVRALGPPFLKNAIGKGAEDYSLVERDLMSSTSADVCELWNGHNVVRVAAPSKIEEFIRVSVNSDTKFRVGAVGRKEFFEPYPDTNSSSSSEDEKQQPGPPNLLLNLGSPSRRFRVMTTMIIACVLQSGFLVLLGFLKFQSDLTARFNRIPLYSFIAALAGTVILTLALILCAYRLDRNTIRKYWAPKVGTKQALLIWMQRGLSDNNSLGSYVITKKVRKEIIESHLRTTNSQGHQSQFNSLVSCVILLGVTTGYVAQVVGLASMRYPAQVTLFGITVQMTLLRAFLRQAPHALVSNKCPHLFEMDWLSLAHVLDEDLLRGKARQRAPTWSIVGGRTWTRCHEDPHTLRRTDKSMDLLHFRTELYTMCDWSCPATDMATPLCQAIETLANKHLKAEAGHFTWYLATDLGDGEEDVEFTVKRTNHSAWMVDNGPILSALSLWLFYDQQTGQSRHAAESSLRLLGPINIGINRYLKKCAPAKMCYIRNVSTQPHADDWGEENNIFLKRRFRRNRIVGFNENLGLHLPSTDNGARRERIQGGSRGEQYRIEFELTRACDQPRCTPAAISKVSLAQLYAQHIFSGFMWAVSINMRENGVHLSLDDVYDIASDLALNGFGDQQDMLLCLLPPLLNKNIVDVVESSRIGFMARQVARFSSPGPL